MKEHSWKRHPGLRASPYWRGNLWLTEWQRSHYGAMLVDPAEKHSCNLL